MVFRLKPRQKFIKKNFFLSFLLAIILWTSWTVIFFLIPPEYFLLPSLFLALTFISVLVTGSLLFANTRRGLLIAIGIVLFMGLRYWEIGNYLNLLLLSGAILSLEYYLSTK